MMAKPIKTLELHYPMIQSLIKNNTLHIKYKVKATDIATPTKRD